MSQNLLLLLWELAVAVSAFGFGSSLLRLLRIRRASLAVTGVTGVSFWILIGGWINAASLIERPVLFALIAIGCVLAAAAIARGTLLRRAREYIAEQNAADTPRVGFAVLALAVVALAVFVAAGTKAIVWNYDDLQGYIAMAVKALQKHAIQPDLFCERRIQAGVGGANFLDSLMLAQGDFRALQFIDSGLGYLLYALGMWAVARRLRVPLLATALVLLCLPLFTLMKVNLTIVYLSSAGLLALLLVLFWSDKDGAAWQQGVLIGLIGGALLTTKSTNLPFTVALVFLWATLASWFRRGATAWKPVWISVPVALFLVLPWSLQSKRTSGTYLYPLLGKGAHVSAYGLIPTPSQAGTLAQMVVVALPNVVFVFGLLLCAWYLTSAMDASTRAALLAFLAASGLSILAVTYGLGGEAVDRYSAPFVMPALLLGFLLLCSPDARSASAAWRTATGLLLAGASAYCVFFLGISMDWYGNDGLLLSYLFRLNPDNQSTYLFRFDRDAFRESLAYGRKIQAALPPGATALADMQNSFVFDFRRNTIYVQDIAAMASPAPGFPVNGSVADVKAYLQQQGIQYLILDRAILCGPEYHWQSFLQHQRLRTGWPAMLRNPGDSHTFLPWSWVEANVSCRARSQPNQITKEGRAVYNDPRVIVTSLE